MLTLPVVDLKAADGGWLDLHAILANHDHAVVVNTDVEHGKGASVDDAQLRLRVGAVRCHALELGVGARCQVVENAVTLADAVDKAIVGHRLITLHAVAGRKAQSKGMGEVQSPTCEMHQHVKQDPECP